MIYYEYRHGEMQEQDGMYRNNLHVIKLFKIWLAWLPLFLIMNFLSSLGLFHTFAVLRMRLNFIIAHDEMN